DLSLAGHAVRLARWTDAEIDFAAIRARGGLDVVGEPRHLVSGRLGLATPTLVNDLAAATRDADLIVVDLAPADLEARMSLLAPHLRSGQVVHVNTCSYWSSLRAARVLREAGVAGVVLTEIIAPTLTADYRGARLET